MIESKVNDSRQQHSMLTPNHHGVLGLHSQTDLDRLTWCRAEVVVTQVQITAVIGCEIQLLVFDAGTQAYLSGNIPHQRNAFRIC